LRARGTPTRVRWALAGVPGTTLSTILGVTSGANFPDGLGSAAAVGAGSGVLLLTAPTVLSAGHATFLLSRKALIGKVTFYGGTGAVSQSAEDAAVKALE
jgi:hypothetical protein